MSDINRTSAHSFAHIPTAIHLRGNAEHVKCLVGKHLSDVRTRQIQRPLLLATTGNGPRRGTYRIRMRRSVQRYDRSALDGSHQRNSRVLIVFYLDITKKIKL